MASEMRIFFSDEDKDWVFALCNATHKSPSDIMQNALRYYKDGLNDLGLSGLVLAGNRNTGPSTAPPRGPVKKMDRKEQYEAVILLINQILDTSNMDFLGFGYLAKGPMLENGVCRTKGAAIELLNEMVEAGILIAEKRDGKEEGSIVSTIDVNEKNELVINLLKEEEER